MPQSPNTSTKLNTQLIAPLLTACCLLATSSCIVYVDANEDNPSSPYKLTNLVNGQLKVSEHKKAGKLSSVNGSVKLEKYAQAKTINTVNGNVHLKEHSRAQQVTTVNGNVSISKHVRIDGNTSTVNGSIAAAPFASFAGNLSAVNGRLQLKESSIEGDVKNINGQISLHKTKVNGAITTENGDVKLSNQSWVGGDLVIGTEHKHYDNGMPTLTIDLSSKVEGSIHLYRQVTLNVTDPALKQRIIHAY